MGDFFSNEIGYTISWFSLGHFLLIIGFILSLVLIWWISPKIKQSKYEKVLRFFLVGLVILFEWRVFESRMLENSIFRMPLCAVSLYGLTLAIAFSKEKAFRIIYFYAFGTFLTFLFFDTLWGLDRWSGWTFFGAHACIGWLAVYGVTVLDYRPTKSDLYKSMLLLAIFALISGYATYRFGGSDELFLFHPPLVEVQFLIDIHPLLYQVIFSSVAALLMGAMYLPIFISNKIKKGHA
ncbi:Integral membrane protein [Candidatus Izimaplasma bacterium HR1]|jgi:uncharacterized membrane protein YwaF|uniref:TMEM164 family acyltransferase n=1 Tax=Candidatus Izimoplasma sp. HR1 TaxID=1541959 RepID=UPI0004F6FB8C|nr:Integral membrane protein [Candidatus Izimaplasma bacterium HR1]